MPALHPLKVEEIVAQGGQPMPFVGEDAEELASLLFGNVARQQQVREPDQAGQRRPQLVAHDRDQLVLDPVQLALAGHVMEQRAHARLLAWAGGDVEQPYAHVAVGWPEHRHLKARVLVRMGERAPPGSRGAAWVAKARMDAIEDLSRGFTFD